MFLISKSSIIKNKKRISKKDITKKTNPISSKSSSFENQKKITSEGPICPMKKKINPPIFFKDSFLMHLKNNKRDNMIMAVKTLMHGHQTSIENLEYSSGKKR